MEALARATLASAAGRVAVGALLVDSLLAILVSRRGRSNDARKESSILIVRLPSAYPANTPRRDAGLDARVTTGRNLPEATLEARLRPQMSAASPTPELDEPLNRAFRKQRQPPVRGRPVLLMPMRRRVGSGREGSSDRRTTV